MLARERGIVACYISENILDLDDEQVRFDKSNKHTQDILASLIVEFRNGTYEMKFKEKRTPQKK